MNRPFRILPYREGDAATLYTVQVEGRPDTETELFRRSRDVLAAPDFPRLDQRLTQCYQSKGLYHAKADQGWDRYFRYEGDGCSALWAPIPREDLATLPDPPPTLRLYGFRIDRRTLGNCRYVLDDLGFLASPIAVFCRGGVKTEASPQVCQNVAGPFAEAHHIMRRLVERIDDGSVWITDDGFELEGDLDFPARP